MKERISLSIGISIIIIIIWRILLLKREPYNILGIISWIQVIIILSIMVWNIIEMYSIIRILKKDIKQGWIVQQVVKGINYVYWGPLASVEARIVNEIPSIRERLVKLGDKLINNINDKKRIQVMLIVITIMPRLVVGISLSIDVVYYGRIELMYKAMWLLIIPIMFNTIIGMVKHEAEKDKKKLEEESLTVSYKEGQVYIQSKDTKGAIARYTENKNQWIRNYNIIDVIKAIEIVKLSKEILYMRIITQVIYISSWTIYILKIIKYMYIKYIIYKRLKKKTIRGR
jgi:hypothetical protein